MRRALILAAIFVTQPAQADQLYRGSAWSAMATDRTARDVGDTITVLIHQAARASSKLQNNSSKKTIFGGRFAAGGIDEGDRAVQISDVRSYGLIAAGK